MSISMLFRHKYFSWIHFLQLAKCTLSSYKKKAIIVPSQSILLLRIQAFLSMLLMLESLLDVVKETMVPITIHAFELSAIIPIILWSFVNRSVDILIPTSLILQQMLFPVIIQMLSK